MKLGKSTPSHSLSAAASRKNLKKTFIENYESILDEIVVNILCVRIYDIDVPEYIVKVTFCDQVIVKQKIIPFAERDEIPKNTCLASGIFRYDPSDYETMCMYVDNPLVVQIQPALSKSIKQAYCCNVDIMSLFIGTEEISTTKRMRPLERLPISMQKSWCNLPCISLKIVSNRISENKLHHDFLHNANYMTLTVIGAYNVLEEYENNESFIYNAASQMPTVNNMNHAKVNFTLGHGAKENFDCTTFYPHWETLRSEDDNLSESDVKINFFLDDIVCEEIDNIEDYLNKPSNHTLIWRSFHRSLLVGDTLEWFEKFIHKFSWPLEVYIYGKSSPTAGGYFYMAFLDLVKLLYPGEHKLILAVPLQITDPVIILERSGIDPLLLPTQTYKSSTKGSVSASTVYGPTSTLGTGFDGKSAFVLVKVNLGRPLKKISIPRIITNSELENELLELEMESVDRVCTSRGQQDRDWRSTVRMALLSLQKVPYYGMTEFCAFNRQLSETRTRVEIMTSLWQDAAIFINNNFVISDYLSSEKIYDEMIMMAHVCLMKATYETIIGSEDILDLNHTLKAARHAKQMQDTSHAAELYMQYLSKNKYDSSVWRELSSCLKVFDRSLALVCLRKSLSMNPRDPLSLLAMGCLVYEKNPRDAEVFFEAILRLYPFWAPGWVTINAYYNDLQLFHVADKVMELIKKTHSEGLLQDLCPPSAWERELGDWWDPTPIMPGVSRYYEAADLLLRLRAIPLAEMCIARALSEAGESITYYHMLGLSCRLKGNFQDAICHLRAGIKLYNDIHYLRSLEAECLHRSNDIEAAMNTFHKVSSFITPFSNLIALSCFNPQRKRTMLVDLVRQKPNAYAWCALAEDWLKRQLSTETTSDDKASAAVCATASAIQALRYDRRFGKAWALLSQLVMPEMRRSFCKAMAYACGYRFTDDKNFSTVFPDDLCYDIGKALQDCRCELCENLKANN